MAFAMTMAAASLATVVPVSTTQAMDYGATSQNTYRWNGSAWDAAVSIGSASPWITTDPYGHTYVVTSTGILRSSNHGESFPTDVAPAGFAATFSTTSSIGAIVWFGRYLYFFGATNAGADLGVMRSSNFGTSWSSVSTITAGLNPARLMVAANATEMACFFYDQTNSLGKLAYTSDGTSFSLFNFGGNFAVNSSCRIVLAASPTHFAICFEAGSTDCYTAPTGSLNSWTARFTSAGGKGLTYSSALGLFALVDQGGDIRTASGTNPVTWTSRSNPLGAVAMAGVCWVQSLAKFYAVSTAGGFIESADGLTWSAATTSPDTSAQPRMLVAV